jgi:DNA topoisomerase-3
MSIIGILTEKPSAMRNFAKALGGQSGTYNGEQYVIVSARGHLYEYVEPEDMVYENLASKYKSWSLENLPWNEKDFNWKKFKKKDTVSLLSDLKKILSACSEIVIATDVDPSGEGDLLAGEVLVELKLTGKKISRMFFLDESEKEITKAFKTRKHIPNIETYSEYVKAQYRAQFDFLTMQFTRIAKALGDGQSVLRQGRLKSAMVVIVGDGLTAFNDYKKIPYYQNRFKDENGNIYTNDGEKCFPNKEDVPNIYNKSAVVKDRTERKKTPPKKLLDLAGLSAILSAKGIKAKDVLAVYQKMYESQRVSYPRTEDKVISPEQFNELLPLCGKIAAVVGVDTG